MLKDSLEMFRSTRVQTMAMVDGLTQAQIDHVPARGKWSIGEVLDHLILGQRLNVCYIAEVIEMKKAGRQPVRKLNFSDVDVSVGYIPKSVLPVLETPFTILNMFVPTGVRDFMTRNRLVPAQNPNITTPRRGRSSADLHHDLVSSLKELRTLLESHAHLDFSEMMIMHPLLGANNVPGLVRFLALHEQRHQSQIDDVLKSPRFPKSDLSGAGDPHVE